MFSSFTQCYISFKIIDVICAKSSRNCAWNLVLVVSGCGLGHGSKFSFVTGWVGSVNWWAGLDWVNEIGPTDNSAFVYLWMHKLSCLQLGSLTKTTGQIIDDTWRGARDEHPNLLTSFVIGRLTGRHWVASYRRIFFFRFPYILVRWVLWAVNPFAYVN